MTKRYWISASIFAVMLIFISCSLKKNNPTDNTQAIAQGGPVTVTGQVISNTNGNAVVGAEVTVQVDSTFGARTDSLGRFQFIVTIKKGGDLMIITSKPQYKPDTTHFFAVVNQTINVGKIILYQNKTILLATGYPASIQLINQTLTSVGVKESGTEEASTFTYQVQDSSGVGVDVNHGTTVSFSISGGPNGGEFVSPLTVHTDGHGNVSTTFNSGIKAGVAMIVAQAVSNGLTLKSRPIPITVQGGLPVSYHFTFLTILPSWSIKGEVISVSVLVGDRYSNPVRPGTTVYFTTNFNGISNYNGGVIQGSAVTDDQGHATVTMTTEDKPAHPDLLPGQFVVTASTVDENGLLIQIQLFSTP